MTNSLYNILIGVNYNQRNNKLKFGNYKVYFYCNYQFRSLTIYIKIQHSKNYIFNCIFSYCYIDFNARRKTAYDMQRLFSIVLTEV